MQNNQPKKKVSESGYTLIELLIVVVLISLVSLLLYSRLYSDSKEIGGGERLLQEAAVRVVERRNEALRLNGENKQIGVIQNVKPLPINFSDLSATGSLITEGDDDGDCFDDLTRDGVTCLQAGNSGDWTLAFRNDPLQMPDNWKLVLSASDLGSIPLIGNGSGGRGILTSVVGFDASGRGYAKEIGSVWLEKPTGSTGGGTFQTSPFWAIYFVPKDSKYKTAVAVAVHPGGLVERFRFDGTNWIGFKNRNL